MPKGTTFIHPTLRNIFILGEDGNYYQDWDDGDWEPGIEVVYQIRPTPGAPPGFYFVDSVEIAPPEPKVVKVEEPPPPQGIGGAKLPDAITKGGPPPQVNVAPKLVTPPALPNPGAQPRELRNRKTREDFEAIAKKVDELEWDRQKGYGPSLQVETPLKWEGEGRELYLKVHEEFQDQPIPGTRLFYYVGTIGINFGKGGFRISAHSKVRVVQNGGKKVVPQKCVTYTVLHIEN